MLNRVLPDQFRLCTSSSQTPDQRASAEPRAGPPVAAEQDAGEPTAVDGWKQVRAKKKVKKTVSVQLCSIKSLAARALHATAIWFMRLVFEMFVCTELRRAV